MLPNLDRSMRRRTAASSPQNDGTRRSSTTGGGHMWPAVTFLVVVGTYGVFSVTAAPRAEVFESRSVDKTEDALAIFEAFRQQVMPAGVWVHADIRLGEEGSVGTAQRGIIASVGLERKSTLIELPVACALSSAVARGRSAYAKSALAVANHTTSNQDPTRRKNTLTASMLLAIALVELFIHGKMLGDPAVPIVSRYGTQCDGLLAAYAADLKLHLEHDRGFLQHWGNLGDNSDLTHLETEILKAVGRTEAGALLAQWRLETEALYQHLVDGIGAEAASKDGVTVELCDLARLAISSRAFAVPLPASMELEAAIERQATLLPIIDLSNHYLPRPLSPLVSPQDVQLHSAFKALAVVKATNKTVDLKLTEPVVPGHAISVSYGMHPNSKMLVNYGFTMPWVGAMTCLTHARLTLEAPELNLPELVVWASRCFEKDVEVEKVLRVLRWRELLAAGEKDLADSSCSQLEIHRQATSWYACRKSPSAAIELSTWSAFSSLVGNAQAKLQESLSHVDQIETGHVATHAVNSARLHVVQIINDELVVLKVLAAVSNAVTKECGGSTDVEEAEQCVVRVRVVQSLEVQWADAVLDGLVDGDDGAASEL